MQEPANRTSGGRPGDRGANDELNLDMLSRPVSWDNALLFYGEYQLNRELVRS